MRAGLGFGGVLREGCGGRPEGAVSPQARRSASEPRRSPTRAQRGARPETHLELRSDITVPGGGGFLSAIGGFRGEYVGTWVVGSFFECIRRWRGVSCK